MFYKLLGKLAVPCGDDVVGWAMTFGDDRHVAETWINGVYISTSFLGLDHNHAAIIDGDDDAPPILFETMIFPTDQWDHYQTRCATWDQAINMHNSAVAMVRVKLRRLPMIVEEVE
jgi:hypothetical protein